ncbi:hypothetical protein C0Z01_09070 [Photobacterium kishitanii]|nr:hypothetical protein AYY22_01015 [Photobacterium kishitanii]PSU87496.1 hypothetical protein C0W42_15930 [Photobacterium kishitanii]PSU91993.1 hypothetical protein C0W35_14940 [Photobacterium kishitanii]PSV10982.1 hypothetical protein C0W28_19050 [Photobacterium kishitanii]PSW69621.1 hypothetical protein C0Z01_09070 [Photobacterium kishitanii]
MIMSFIFYQLCYLRYFFRITKNNQLNIRTDNSIYVSSCALPPDSSTSTYKIANHCLLVFFIDQKKRLLLVRGA